MKNAPNEALAYDATLRPLTELGAHASRVRALLESVAELCHVVQGLVVHPFLAHLYGLEAGAIRHAELELRSVSEMLDRVLALDPRPLSKVRAPEKRLVGNCRHFTLLLCAFLRAKGVPARARCGFGAWFERPRFTDHWVCEARDAARGAWHRVNAQLDARQREAFQIGFDTLDVPRQELLVAADAWHRCGREGADPQDFGILDLRGVWFVRGNLIRDLAARAKRELLPWDGWGLMADLHESDADELALLDRTAKLLRGGADRHAALLALQDSEAGLRVPAVVRNLQREGAPVELPSGVAN